MLVLGGIFALGIVAGVVVAELAEKLMKQETQARRSAFEEPDPAPDKPEQPARRWWEFWRR